MLLDRINAHARAHPERTAIVQEGVAISYATFARAIAVLRRHFAASNLPAKGLAVVRTELLADSWATTIALRSVGLDTISVPSLAMVADLQLRNLVCIVAHRHELANEDLGAPAVGGRQIVLLPQDLWKAGANTDLPEPAGARDPAGGHIVYTSGTTGTSKKLLMSAEQDERRIARKLAILGWPAQSALYSGSLGLWGAVAYNYPPFVWSVGGYVVFDQGADPWSRFFKFPLTHAIMNPVQARQLVTSVSEPATKQNIQIRLVGAVASIDLVEELRRKVSPDIVAHYGSSECEIVMGTPLRTADDIQWYVPEADRTVEIIDEDGRPCGDGEEGEMRIRLAESDCTSYLDDPEATAQFFRDGCFYPGDFAARRSDGRIRLLGRVADVLNIGGHKVAVGPLEQQIQQILGVDHVCLFSQLSDAGKDELAIAYEATDDAPAGRMQQLARQFPIFSHVRFERFGQFPRVGTLQKTDRWTLKHAIFDRPASRR